MAPQARTPPGSLALLPETLAGVLLLELRRGVMVPVLSPVPACPWEQRESWELLEPVPLGHPSPCLPGPRGSPLLGS